MTRTAEGPILDLLNALEPEAKAAWEAEEISTREAIMASQAITDKRGVTVQIDATTIDLTSKDTVTQDQVPDEVRDIYDPTYSGGGGQLP